MLAHYDEMLVDRELQLVRQAKKEAPRGFHALDPGHRQGAGDDDRLRAARRRALRARGALM